MKISTKYGSQIHHITYVSPAEYTYNTLCGLSVHSPKIQTDRPVTCLVCIAIAKKNGTQL